ncbi:hypothetical protein MUK42_05440 [Musa troglodytarum]|uniref:Uncharacterized protein n=1 Tax=Musa troglodytarum TaxID=320322 RepID=A0A9E7ELN0_9LILI|nr:hypothetical protein MUK42_05440 [Musa troglodytarum]
MGGNLYALDFDGVLCDSCGESSRSALKASTRLLLTSSRTLLLSLLIFVAAKIRWPWLFGQVDSAMETWIIDQMHIVSFLSSIMTSPVFFFSSFDAEIYLDLLTHTYHYEWDLLDVYHPSCVQWLKQVADGLTVEAILENWSQLKPIIMKEWDEERDALIDLFGRVRDEWIDNDLSGWIGSNRFADALLRELAGVSLPAERIYGLGTGFRKHRIPKASSEYAR